MQYIASRKEINQESLKEALEEKLESLERIAQGNDFITTDNWLERVCEFKSLYEKAIPYLDKSEIKKYEEEYEKHAIKYWDMKKNA